MMSQNPYYDQLVSSEPLGFIDPFEDLGTFDAYHMRFKESVRELINPHSGKPYSPKWQTKIQEMRKLYIKYQASLREEPHHELSHRMRSEANQAYVDKIITTYLTLGFHFSEIERQLSVSSKNLRARYKRSDYIKINSLEVYDKQDLSDGYMMAKDYIPENKMIK